MIFEIVSKEHYVICIFIKKLIDQYNHETFRHKHNIKITQENYYIYYALKLCLFFTLYNKRGLHYRKFLQFRVFVQQTETH